MTARPSGDGGGAAAPPPFSVPAPARLHLAAESAASRWRVKPLGVSPLGGPLLLGLSVHDARHHLHVPGPTGTGKSTLLVNLVCAEARAGRGVAVFDPKGDLIRDLLDRLPASVAGRIVLIDPDETEAPVALNLFDLGTDPESVTDQLVEVMAKVWAQYWGPRTDDLARHAVLTLAHTPGATFADLPRLLTDPGWRRLVVAGLRRRLGDGGAGLAGFWAGWDQMPPGQQSVTAGPLLSKLRAVLIRRFTAGLFGVGASTFRLPDILAGGILLVRLPIGVLGEDTVRLTGSLLLAALFRAAYGRADMPEQQRPDASIVLDEAHYFLNLPIGVEAALSELRGLRVSMVLAHQYLDQLSGPMLAGIEANARNKLIFAVSPRDARVLAHHVAPYFDADDLVHRDAYGLVARLVIDGRDAEPFTLHTRPAPPPWPGRALLLRAAARTRGLSQADRAALAQARRLGPSAPTSHPAPPVAAQTPARPTPTAPPVTPPHRAKGTDDA